MTAQALLADLHARGVTVDVQGDRLRLAPAAAVVPELLEAVRAHKSELLSLLTAVVAEAELAAQRQLASAFEAWRQHVRVVGCLGCDPGDPAKRCDVARDLQVAYHLAWRAVHVVPFGGER